MNALKADARSVKSNTCTEGVLGECLAWDGDVMPAPPEVAEFEVDILNLIFVRERFGPEKTA
jgi:hypothetical protein